MSRLKRGLGIDVLAASRQRISFLFDRFERLYVSFLPGYMSWLGSREDSPDRRAEYAASRPPARPRHRLGLKIGEDAVGWCLVALDDTPDPAHRPVTGADVLDRLRQPGESQRDMARRLGIGVRTLQRIHSGGELPPASLILMALAAPGPDVAGG